MNFNRKQYLDLMTFKTVDRQMFVELFGTLIGLEDEWRAQGASREEINLEAFDWDFVSIVDCGGVTGIFGGSEKKIIDETEEYVPHFAPMDSHFREFRLSLAHERRTNIWNPTNRPSWDSGWRMPGNIPDRTNRRSSQGQ